MGDDTLIDIEVSKPSLMLELCQSLECTLNLGTAKGFTGRIMALQACMLLFKDLAVADLKAVLRVHGM